MRIRTFSVPSILAVVSVAVLAACGTSGSSPVGNTAPTATASASATPLATTPAATQAPAATQLGKYNDGEVVGFRAGNVCVVPANEVAQSTGLDITQAQPETPACTYAETEPTYAVQSVSLEIRYALPSSAAAAVASATQVAGFPANTRAYELNVGGVDETIVYLPERQLLATCWSIGTDDIATMHAQKALCLWISTGDHLLRHVPLP